MPVDVLKPALAKAVNDPGVGSYGCNELDPPKPNTKYIITADPAGFGARGDKSALTVWDAEERREVAFWEEREDPAKFARRLLMVQKYYGGAMLIVESNATACIAILRDSNAKNLLWTDRSHPGWYATDKRIQEAEARLVRMIRQGDIEVRSRGLLHQLVNYDGSRKKRAKGLDGTTHHFDRARTAVMAADILSKRKFNKVQNDVPSSPYVPGQVTIKDLDKIKHSEKMRYRNPYKPVSRFGG